MEEYEKPVMEIVYIDRSDIIITSPGTGNPDEAQEIGMTNNTNP